MIYYIILTLIFAASFLFKRKTYSIIITMILVLFAGLRANVVGTDTIMYKELYEDMQYIHNFKELINDYNLTILKVEIGYYLSEFVFEKFVSFEVFKLCQSAMAIIPWGYLFYKRSKNLPISFGFLFATPVFGMMAMCAMRQGIAFGFVALLIDALMDGKKKKAILFNVAAFLFHSSSIIFVPLFFADKLKPYKHKYVVYIVPLLAVLYASSTVIFNFLGKYSRVEYEVGDAGGIGTLVFFLVLYGLTFLVNENHFKDKINNWLLYLLLITIGLWFIGMNLAAIFRLSYYTYATIALFVPNVLSCIKRPLNKIVIAGVIAGSILIMSKIVVSETKGNHYYPYYFTWEDTRGYFY